jgi:hypothetical protein
MPALEHKQRYLEHLLLGLGIALYLSRVLAEQATTPYPWPVVLFLALTCLVLAVTLIGWAHRLHYHVAPLMLCYGYALYPRPHPSFALAIGLTALLGLVIVNPQARRGATTAGSGLSHWVLLRPTLPSWIGHVLVFLGGLALYWSTLAPSLLPGDAGEFQLVASLLGVAHPPGYPLYTLLGHLFTLLPMGDLAFRVNLLSAVIGALTLGLVSLAVHQLSRSLWPGLAAALTLAGATTFWAQATTASIRGLTALFTVLILLLALSYDGAQGQSRRRRRLLTALGLAFGLGISHHGSLGFMALPVGAYLIAATGPRRSGHCARILGARDGPGIPG